MIKQIVLVLLLFLFNTNQRKIIIDTDSAVDDIAAILYLTLQPQDKFDIQSILVTGTGEAYCKQGVENILRLLEFSQFKDIPVACGQNHPTKGYLQFCQIVRDHANDNFFPFIDDKIAFQRQQREDINAPDLIINQLKQSNEPIDFVVLGPITNIHLALEKDPSIGEKIGEIYFMGGAVDVEGNLHIPPTHSSPNRVSEWNVFSDAYASQQVFRNKGIKNKIKLISLDGTNTVPVRKEFLDSLQEKLEKDLHLTELKGVKNPVQYFIDIFQECLKLFSNDMFFWDVLAAVAAVDDKVCQFEVRNLDVVVEELNENEEISDYLQNFEKQSDFIPKEGRRHLRAETTGNVIDSTVYENQVKVCKQVDRELFDYEIYIGLLGQKIRQFDQSKKSDL